jgi:hypothetical protein
LKKRTLGSGSHLTAHQDAELIDFLPLIIQRQERPDLKIPGGAVNGFRNLAPVVEIANDLPIHVAVIDDEKLAASRARAVRHLNLKLQASSSPL